MTSSSDNNQAIENSSSDLFDNRLFDINIVDPINSDNVFYNKLIVTDGVGSNTLKQRLIIKNMTNQTINFTEMVDFPASEEYHHFELKFHNGVFLESDYFPKFAEVDNWHISEPRINTETDIWSIHFVSRKPISLLNEESLTFDFEYRSAIGISSSQYEGMTELEFYYHQLKVHDDTNHTQGNVTRILSIINQSSGNPYIKDMRDYLVKNHKKIDGIELNVLSKLYGLKNLSNQRDDEIEASITKNRTELDAKDNELAESIANNRTELDAKDKVLIESIANNRDELDAKDNELVESIANNRAELDAKDNVLVKSIANNRNELDAKDNELVESIANNRAELDAKDNVLVKSIANNRNELDAKDNELIESITNNRTELDAKDNELAESIANNRTELDAKDNELVESIANNRKELDAKDSELAESIVNARTDLGAKDSEFEVKISDLFKQLSEQKIAANQLTALVELNDERIKSTTDDVRDNNVEQHKKIDEYKFSFEKRLDNEIVEIKENIDKNTILINEKREDIVVELAALKQKSLSISELVLNNNNAHLEKEKEIEKSISDLKNDILEKYEELLNETANNSLLRNASNDNLEKPVIGQTYISPSQHGEIFGRVFRRYIDNTFKNGDVITNSLGGELIDSKLLIKHANFQSSLDDVSYNSKYRARFQLFDGGDLKIQITPGYSLRGGWVDYVEGKPQVTKVKASSHAANWLAENVLSSEQRTYWMSETNSGNEEWVELIFNQGFIATSVNIVLNNGRQGSSPSIQGSFDGKDWVELAKVNSFDFPNDDRNFRHIDIQLNNDQKFKHYRYHSSSTVYVLLEYIRFK